MNPTVTTAATIPMAAPMVLGVAGIEMVTPMRPNVRVKPAPTVGRQAPATENVHRTCCRGLVARRWGSA